MKYFLFPSEIQPSAQWVLLYLNALLIQGEKSKYFFGAEYVPRVPDPGNVDPTRAHIIFTQWFICINESNPSLIHFLIGSFMIFEQRDNEEDSKFLNTFSSIHTNRSHICYRNSLSMDISRGRKRHSIVFSNSISGIHNGGSPPPTRLSSLLQGLGMKLSGAEYL